MLSGIGPSDQLTALGLPVLVDLPAVGKNFKNHVTLRTDSSLTPNLTIENPEKLYFGKYGPLSQFPYTLAYLSSSSNDDINWPNIFLTSYIGTKNTIAHMISLARIKSVGEVRLQSTSPYIQPSIDPNHLSDPTDLENFSEGVRFMLYISEHPVLISDMTVQSLKQVGCDLCPVGTPDFECVEGINCYIKKATSMHHPCCTCRMGAADRADTVVTPQLNVKGCEHLRVCDASIMPDLINANTNAATMMIGEYCAQIIKNNYKI